MSRANIATVNGERYEVLRLLGKGKGGYSFLVRSVAHPSMEYVIKQFHRDPRRHHLYEDTLQSEIRCYRRLRELGIRLPAMLDVDIDAQRILKEYIDGPTVYELVRSGGMKDDYVAQIRDMAKRLTSHRVAIDYFPTNFVVDNELIYYIDFECEDYTAERSFERRGEPFWARTEAFLAYEAELLLHASPIPETA